MIMVYDGPGACNMFWDPLDPWTPLYTGIPATLNRLSLLQQSKVIKRPLYHYVLIGVLSWYGWWCGGAETSGDIIFMRLLAMMAVVLFLASSWHQVGTKLAQNACHKMTAEASMKAHIKSLGKPPGWM